MIKDKYEKRRRMRERERERETSSSIKIHLDTVADCWIFLVLVAHTA